MNEIKDRAFSDIDYIEELELVDVTKIGNEAFSSCIELVSIILPEELVEIGNGAFKNCKKLKLIVLPKSLSRIGTNIFEGCESLMNVTIMSPWIRIYQLCLPIDCNVTIGYDPVEVQYNSGIFDDDDDGDDGDDDGDDKIQRCSLCFNKISDSAIKVTKCIHIFHKDCVDEWLKNELNCPQCNTIIA
jgi:BspA type Leucine rich repeat region (6 copies)/Ring finger domain